VVTRTSLTRVTSPGSRVWLCGLVSPRRSARRLDGTTESTYGNTLCSLNASVSTPYNQAAVRRQITASGGAIRPSAAARSSSVSGTSGSTYTPRSIRRTRP